jgi:hypothetical protein
MTCRDLFRTDLMKKKVDNHLAVYLCFLSLKFKKLVSNFGCLLPRLNELISEGLENGDAEAFVGGNQNQRVLNDL